MKLVCEFILSVINCIFHIYRNNNANYLRPVFPDLRLNEIHLMYMYGNIFIFAIYALINSKFNIFLHALPKTCTIEMLISSERIKTVYTTNALTYKHTHIHIHIETGTQHATALPAAHKDESEWKKQRKNA